jgi:hypothetical protein
LQDVGGDLACIGGILCPMDLAAGGLQLIGKMSEETVEVSESVEPDGSCPVT